MKGQAVNPRIWSAVLPSFLVSRAIVFTLMLVGPLVSVASVDGILSLNVRRPVSLYAALSSLAGTGDAAAYREIAAEGYGVPQNRSYFPGFPLIWRGAARLTREYPVTGIFISNVCFLAALPILYLLCLEVGCSSSAAERAVFYACFYPVSHFFSLPLTESLFFLLSIGSVYLAVREKWALAGFVGMGAAATRLVGLMLVPTLALIWWRRYRRPSPAIIFAIVPALGLAGFCTYMYAAYGDALAFLHSQSSYGHSLQWGAALLDYLRSPRIFHAWHFYPLHFVSVMVAGMSIVALIKRGKAALAVYLIGCIAIPLSSDLASMTRYAMDSFPLFLGISYLTENPRVDCYARVVSASLLAVMALACGFRFGLAMT